MVMEKHIEDLLTSFLGQGHAEKLDLLQKMTTLFQEKLGIWTSYTYQDGTFMIEWVRKHGKVRINVYLSQRYLVQFMVTTQWLVDVKRENLVFDQTLMTGMLTKWIKDEETAALMDK